MLGIITKYKSDINRALFQISPANIVGQYLAFTIDLNNAGTILNDNYAFSIGDTENTLFKHTNFQLAQFVLGKTALRFVRGESPKMVVGYKEVQIAGFPKYKFITLDVEKARSYFNANYGKMSIADIVSHLNSIKNTLVQTSFFTTDMLPKSVVVKELTMPKQAKNVMAKSEGYPSYIDSDTYKFMTSPFYSQTQEEKTLLVDNRFWFALGTLRSFEESGLLVNLCYGYADDTLNIDYIPAIEIDMRYLFKPRVFNNLTSVNEFWGNIVHRYDNTQYKEKLFTLPQSLGNGMTSFDGENLYVGNFLKNSGNPIIGIFAGFDSAKQELTYFLPSWETFFNQRVYNISKSQIKASIKLEKYKSKSKILLKYPDTNSFNKATGIDKVIDLQKSSATKNTGGTKDEQFANSLSLIDSSKVQSLSNKNPKFKEVFDLAIAEIYKTYIASPTPIQQNIKKEFYFPNSGNLNIYMSRVSNLAQTNTFGKKVFSSSDIPQLQELLNSKKSDAVNGQIGNRNANRYFYFDFSSAFLYFDNEPPVFRDGNFFSISRLYDPLKQSYYTEIKFGELRLKCDGEISESSVESLLSYFFDNLVEFSLKATITIKTLLACASGKKEDMLEYFQKQVKFLIDHDLILSKENLLEVQSVINKIGVVKLENLFDKFFFFKEGKSLRVFTENDVTNVFGELIDLCCENNPDLNEYFNPPMVISAEPVVEPIIEEPQIITTEPQVVEDDDFADIFAENNEVNRKLQELQQLRQEVAGQDNLIDNLDL